METVLKLTVKLAVCPRVTKPGNAALPKGLDLRLCEGRDQRVQRQPKRTGEIEAVVD
ncbi:MAG: hypothetical protein ABSE73_28450 [Planctomycetota bacterium]